MTRRNCLKLFLVLPLAVPLLALPILIGPGALPGLLPAMLAVSLPLAGPPYALFAAALLVYLRRAPLRKVEQTAAWAPLIFVGPLTVYLAVFAWASSETADLSTVVGTALFCIPFGYAYVLMAFGGTFLLTRLGVVEPEHPQPRPLRY